MKHSISLLNRSLDEVTRQLAYLNSTGCKFPEKSIKERKEKLIPIREDLEKALSTLKKSIYED